MKRLITIALMLCSTVAFAQDTVRHDLKSKVFTVQNRDPRVIASAIKLLGSGAAFSDMNVNPELKTITVRDFPENLAAIEDAIKRLDQAAPAAQDVELRISVLIGSKTPLTGAAVPDDLAPVVKQLESALRYSHYGLLTTAVQRTKAGSGVQGSGVADAALLGVTASASRPILWTYALHGVTVESSSARAAISVDSFNFSMKVPVTVNDKDFQYQSVGFETPVSVKEGEKVVIGTTTMRDKALIVVLTATVLK